jgi:hypothetical protein
MFSVPGVVVLGCGGEGEASDTTPGGQPSAPGSSEIEPALPLDGVAGQPGTSPSSEPGVSPEPDFPTPSDPADLVLDVQPGTPTELVGDLTHATRIAFDGSDVLVLHHPSNVEGSTAPDEILRVPRTGGVATAVITEPAMGGFVVDGDRIWVSTLRSAAIIEFDKATGNELSRITLDEGLTTYQVTQNADFVFASFVDGSRIDRIQKSDGARQSLHVEEGSDGLPAQWLVADEEAVYFLYRLDVTPVTLVRMAVDGSSVTDLATMDAATALGAAGDELIAIEHDGTAAAFSKSGAKRELGVVEDAWALSADSNFVYVSVQPSDECPEGYAGQVVKLPLAGGAATLLADGLACPSMLLAADDGIYWVNNGYSSYSDLGGFVSTPTGSLMKLGG